MDVPDATPGRRLGFLAGQISVPDDFNRMGRSGNSGPVRERRVKILLDTHLLLWAAGMPYRLPGQARLLIDHPDNEPMVSVASPVGGRRQERARSHGFQSRTATCCGRGLLENGYGELEVTGAHAAAVDLLPPIHTDPFDRILVAQAQIEGITLLTTDEIVGRYPGPIRAL